MVAKGHDFPGVRLVGVVAADVGLHMPDFRAAERTFQLLTQVAGRAGRDATPGRVVIQTFVPEHYAIRPVREHDYEAFYAEELAQRAALGLPPFGRLVQALCSSEDEAGRAARRGGAGARRGRRRRRRRRLLALRPRARAAREAARPLPLSSCWSRAARRRCAAPASRSPRRRASCESGVQASVDVDPWSML